MPSISYGAGAYKRDNGNFPPLTLINMYVESAKTSENQVALLSRPGLSTTLTNGSGPIIGLFSKQGTFSGDVFSISNTTLYRATTSIGTIGGSSAASFAGSDLELVVTRGSTAKSYLAAGIASIVFPDSANVTAVCYIGSLFVYARAGSGKFYWSTPLDGRTIDALDFATAEREPDQLLDLAPLGDNLWLFGQSTVEAWAHTGAADLPFTRLENVAFDKGIHSTGCVVKADNSLVFVGSNGGVYRVADVPTLISDSWLTEQINASTTARLFTYWLDDHEMVALRLDSSTYVLDCKTNEWHENQTNGGQWIVNCACMVGKTAYLGHQSAGAIMGWSGWDDLGVELERRFSAAQQLDQPLVIDSLWLWANAGQSTVLSGTGSSPLVEMRRSRDAGNTWTDWADAALGNAALGGTGQYRIIPKWRRLGMYDAPGALFEFRLTDPVPFRLSAVKINDPGGGQSRG